MNELNRFVVVNIDAKAQIRKEKSPPSRLRAFASNLNSSGLGFIGGCA